MELNAEQIKKALECCVSGKDCTPCPYIEENGCASMLVENALSLINELTEKEKKLTTERDRYKRYYLNHDYDQMEANIKAETVREMHSEIEERCIKGGIYPAFVKSTIDQIAKEMLEGE